MNMQPSAGKAAYRVGYRDPLARRHSCYAEN